jgi:hypothetical protein
MSQAIYRATELIVCAWVRLYLAGVPRQSRSRRRAEIASDLYEHRLDVEEQGRSQAAAALRLLFRCIAGASDDLLWRSEVGGTSMLRMMRAPIRVAIVTAFILMLPFLAMQLDIGVTDPGDGAEGVNWTPFDFAFAGVLLFSAGLAYELVAKKMSNIAYRAAAGLALASALFLVVVNGAVGIIGSEDNAANLMYGGVLIVGISGAVIARFRPRGMARTLLAMAIAQALIAAIALVAVEMDPSFWGEATRMQNPSPVLDFFGVTPTPVLQLLGVNGMFIALFLGSAWLFRAAARGRTPAGAQPQS